MTTVAIVYHSGYGHTEVQAKAVHKGAASVSGITASLVTVEDATANMDILKDVDAIIFGAPTYMGSASAPFKAFQDASSGAWFNRHWKDKIAAGFTNSHSMSGDKLNTLMQMTIFAMQHGMIWVGQAEMNQSPDGEPGQADAINRIGSFLGAMAQSENAAPDITPPSGDLKTAELLGIRVATLAQKLHS
ncbi:flavodoxin family protein [Kordiimonas pumila]|uniref:Flavodoxin family protein n=1 Tax=Kordiimonas pumila TaxID=2161677 RepID=A0ABV7D1I8_9PROT|nr:flavodoxin family protein [Kordiimonas pumila]